MEYRLKVGVCTILYCKPDLCRMYESHDVLGVVSSHSMNISGLRVDKLSQIQTPDMIETIDPPLIHMDRIQLSSYRAPMNI